MHFKWSISLILCRYYVDLASEVAISSYIQEVPSVSQKKLSFYFVFKTTIQFSFVIRLSLRVRLGTC